MKANKATKNIANTFEFIVLSCDFFDWRCLIFESYVECVVFMHRAPYIYTKNTMPNCSQTKFFPNNFTQNCVCKKMRTKFHFNRICRGAFDGRRWGRMTVFYLTILKDIRTGNLISILIFFTVRWSGIADLIANIFLIAPPHSKDAVTSRITCTFRKFQLEFDLNYSCGKLTESPRMPNTRVVSRNTSMIWDIFPLLLQWITLSIITSSILWYTCRSSE